MQIRWTSILRFPILLMSWLPFPLKISWESGGHVENIKETRYGNPLSCSCRKSVSCSKAHGEKRYINNILWTRNVVGCYIAHVAAPCPHHNLMDIRENRWDYFWKSIMWVYLSLSLAHVAVPWLWKNLLEWMLKTRFKDCKNCASWSSDKVCGGGRPPP